MNVSFFNEFDTMNPKQTQYGVAMIFLFGVRAPKGPGSM